MVTMESENTAVAMEPWAGMARIYADQAGGILSALRAWVDEAARAVHRFRQRIVRGLPRRLTTAELRARDDTRHYARQQRRFILEQRKAAALEFKYSKQEALEIARLFSERLGQLSFDYVRMVFLGMGDGQRRQRSRIRKLVKFDVIEIDADQYRFHVDSEKLPYGRGVNEVAMTQPDVIIALGLTIQKPVSFHLEPGIGLWYLVDRDHGIGNIPVYISYQDTYNAALESAKLKSPLVIPIGLGAGRKPVTINLADDTSAHLLIGGIPGGGKSSLIHLIICTLLRQSADDVKLALFDFKRVEFNPFYKNVPHLLHEIVTEPTEFGLRITTIVEEVKRRYGIMDRAGVDHIDAFNASTGNNIPHIVVIVDELAAVMINPVLTNKKELEADLGYIAMQGRACGIHLVLSTQRPDARVLTGYIRACCPCKIAFACASTDESRIIIGNGHAAYRERVPVGRAILVYSRYEVPFQTGWINYTERNTFAGGSAAGPVVPPRLMMHDVTMTELARFALLNLDGVFKRERLYEAFRHRGISEYDIRHMTKRYSIEPFDIDGKQFTLHSLGFRRPYVIRPANGNGVEIGKNTLIYAGEN